MAAIPVVEIVSAQSGGGLLPAIREGLRQADEALLCVAFVNRGGVALLEPELRRLGPRTRLVATSVFGQTSGQALQRLNQFGTQVRILNPGQGTFHPKVYLGARDDGSVRAVIGSANLTSGLLANVEVAAALTGVRGDREIDTAWHLAEQLWADPAAHERRRAGPASPDGFSPVLFDLIRQTLHPGQTVRTLRDQAPNTVSEIELTGIWVQTVRSQGNPQHVPAWMFDLAWTDLTATGTLSNTRLLNTLHVHRSSVVLAILAHLPDVQVASRSPITLTYQPG